MSHDWAVAIAEFESVAPNTLNLFCGEKLFNVGVVSSNPDWSFGTNEEGVVGFFPSSHVQQTCSRQHARKSQASGNWNGVGDASNCAAESRDGEVNHRSSFVATNNSTTISKHMQAANGGGPSSEPDDVLPDGWQRRTSSRVGRSYYLNASTGEATCECTRTKTMLLGEHCCFPPSCRQFKAPSSTTTATAAF